MIYLITGVPGSGKTLYAVSTLVQKLAAEKITVNGVESGRRVLVDGIPDLLIEHEVLTPMVEDDKGVFACAGDGLLNWSTWCRPGDVIVIDEVQRYWRPRGMGTKPPEMIKALETHRHKGVDFVIITQNPMLIDQNVRRLIGRHQHVRRLFGMQRAVIYDWDGCAQNPLLTKGSTTSFWNYPKKAFALYKSSELHTKQRQKIPAWLIVPVLALVGGVAVMPTAFGTMKGAMTGKGVSSSAVVPAVVPAPSVAVAPSVVASAPLAVASAPNGSAVASVVPVVAGCIRTPKKCACVDSGGLPVPVAEGFCEAHILGNSVPGQKVDLSAVPEFADASRSAGDADVLAFMARRRSSF